jgi:hypothetical protein
VQKAGLVRKRRRNLSATEGPESQHNKTTTATARENAVGKKRHYPNKINVFIEAERRLGQNAPAVLSQQRNFG